MTGLVTDGAAFLREHRALVERYHRQIYPRGCTNPRCTFGCVRPAAAATVKLRDVVTRAVTDAIARHGGRQMPAARDLGCSLSTVKRHARKARRL